jgi:hypothetical protein
LYTKQPPDAVSGSEDDVGCHERSAAVDTVRVEARREGNHVGEGAGGDGTAADTNSGAIIIENR